MKGGVGGLRVALAGQGELDTLRSLSERYGTHALELLGASTGATVWTSVTPLVLPRFQKTRGRNSPEGQVLAELESRRLPPARIEVRQWDAQTLPMRHAVRVRRPPAVAPPVDAGMAVVLTFEEPVRGPLSLGYGSHFGLGLFRAERFD
ncbi:MAG: type I-U CRISPR-associated protein Cas5/Cas6 [Acidobacteria bacterium]|nr:type I-U CRISPR-associated protein Cas5/Cas6 [Acidobacteriota bacterium]